MAEPHPKPEQPAEDDRLAMLLHGSLDTDEPWGPAGDALLTPPVADPSPSAALDATTGEEAWEPGLVAPVFDSAELGDLLETPGENELDLTLPAAFFETDDPGKDAVDGPVPGWPGLPAEFETDDRDMLREPLDPFEEDTPTAFAPDSEPVPLLPATPVPDPATASRADPSARTAPLRRVPGWRSPRPRTRGSIALLSAACTVIAALLVVGPDFGDERRLETGLPSPTVTTRRAPVPSPPPPAVDPGLAAASGAVADPGSPGEGETGLPSPATTAAPGGEPQGARPAPPGPGGARGPSLAGPGAPQGLASSSAPRAAPVAEPPPGPAPAPAPAPAPEPAPARETAQTDARSSPDTTAPPPATSTAQSSPTATSTQEVAPPPTTGTTTPVTSPPATPTLPPTTMPTFEMPSVPSRPCVNGDPPRLVPC